MPNIYDLSHQEYVNLHRRKAKEVAAQMLAGTLGIVEGSRQLSALSHEVELDEATFNIFVGVDSETDTYPLGEVRLLWNADALKVEDQKQMEYEERIKPAVMAACQKLLDD